MFLAVLATLLAQVSPSLPPLPLPTDASAPKTTLTFANALQRLIADAPNFVNDRGAKVTGSDGQTGYLLNFGIAGLTGCRVGPPLFVVCTAYRGTEATMARSAYSTLKAELRAFAPHNVPIFEETTKPPSDGAGKNSFTLTKATYSPQSNVIVLVEMVQSKSAGLWVVLSVVSQPSL